MSVEAGALALERNLALFAGAGSGKTHGLITLCLHLLAGARAQGPVPPSRLWLVTFTDKAAGEMRERLRQRVERLARDGSAPEPELSASFQRLGRPAPPAAFWRGVLDALGGATVTTFHAACGQLLRRAPAGLGSPPDFELLDEREAQALLRECAEEVVLEALARKEPGAVELCRDLEFGLEGSRGLTGALVGVFGKLREEGLSPGALRTSDPDEARSDYEAAVGALKVAVLEAMRLDLEAKQRFSAFLGRCAAVLERLRFEDFWSEEGYPALVAAAKEIRVSGGAELKAAIAEVKARIVGKEEQLGLGAYHAGVLAAGQERAFLALVEALAEAHREALTRRNAQDFAGLLISARDLLAGQPDYRREVQERIGALLVDEFQDTNRIQLELVTLLAERREGERRAVEPGNAAGLPLEHGLLCAVGDRKQSIYEFRGADVSVFEALAEKIVAEGGERQALKRSWRSVPGLVQGLNALFAGVMTPPSDRRDYEVAWEDGLDALEAVRPAVCPARPIEVLAQEPAETSDESREDEAERIACRLAELLASDQPVVGEKDGTLRPLRGGDVAILLRGFPPLETYRQALLRHGLPHRVIRGRGFYGAQEVLDVASLLSVVSDPLDGLALAAVLRSPWVGLADSSWVALATGKGRLSVEAVRQSPDRAQLSSEEQGRLDRLLEVLALLRSGPPLPARILLQLAFERLPFREAWAAAPFGEQALANLEKLLSLAEAWDRRRPGDLDGFAQELVSLAGAEPREAQADAFDLDDPRAIQILTVHQSKGLEWPVVVVPNLASTTPGGAEPWCFDRTLGFALKVRQPDGGMGHTPRTKRIAKELTRRAAAESRRTLYVALTRARDRLLLSGRAKREASSWRAMVQAWIPEAEAQGLLAVVEPEPTAPGAPQRPCQPGAGALADALARVRAPLPPPSGDWVLPVTRLERFAQCPRRYWLTSELGLEEPSHGLAPGAGGSEATGREAAQLRGTLAHRLLEQVDLGLTEDARTSALSALVEREGLDPLAPEVAEVLAWVERFLSGEWGRRLAGEGVHREQPFVLRIPAGPVALCLKGKIDLLIEEPEGVTVLDYKTAREAGGDEAYAFQLGCYALAARAWCRPGGQVRTGVVPLRQGTKVALALRDDLEEVEARLGSLARALVEAVKGGRWEGRAKAQCQAIGCGFVSRCHKGGAAL